MFFFLDTRRMHTREKQSYRRKKHNHKTQFGRGHVWTQERIPKKRIHFSNNTKAPNLSSANLFSPERTTYLNELYEQLHTVIPPNTNIHTYNAEIMGALMAAYDDPANMQKLVDLIYDPQELTPENIGFLQNYKNGPIAKQISRLAAANIPNNTKKKYLNYYRYQRATRKLKKLYNNSYTAVPKTIHPEWSDTSLT